MNLTEIFDWLPLSSIGVGLLSALLGSMIVPLIVALWAHWPQRIPGPLTVQERAKVEAGVVRRVGFALTVPVLGLLALVLLLLALVPIRRPEIVVLMSRSRGLAGPWRDRCSSSAGVGMRTFHDPTTHAVRDLGPVVDEVLDGYVDAPHLWNLDVSGNRETLRKRVLAAFETVEAPRVEHTGLAKQVGSAAYRTLDRRLIETVELSLLTLATDRFNTRGIRIRSDRSYESIRTWSLAQQMMGAKRREFLLCSEGELQPSDPLRISQLTAARIERDGELAFWALIEGQFLGEAAGKTFALDISLVKGDEAGRRLEIQVTIARDDVAGRIVQCPSKTCEMNLAATQRENLAALVNETRAYRGSPWLRLSARRVRGSSDVATPISLAEPTRAWDLEVSDAKPWRRMFETMALPPFEPFRRHLAAHGRLVPRVVETGSPGTDAFVLVDPNGVVVARKREDAIRVAQEHLATPRAVYERSGDWRGERINRGAADAFSWRDLPAHPTLAASHRGGELANTTWTDRERPSTRGQAEAPLIVYIDDPPAVIIGIANATGLLEPRDPKHEPALALALVDAVTDATDQLINGTGRSLADESMTASTSSQGIAEPLVRSADRDKLLDIEMLDRDVILALALALYLAAIAVQIRQP